MDNGGAGCLPLQSGVTSSWMWEQFPSKGNSMKHVWVVLFAVCAPAAVPAQELPVFGAAGTNDSMTSFRTPATSGAPSLFSELRTPTLTSEAASFATHRAGDASAFAAAAEPAAAAPEPKFVFGARDDYRWQLGLGMSLVRFRSSRFYATGVGTSTSLSYFTNEWLAIQGQLTTAFAPTIYQNEHVKYVSYGVGPMVAWREKKIEPWLHVLAGGLHVVPQTADASKNAFAVQLGVGADYRFYPHLSARVGLDWVRSHLFSQWQDSVQATAEVVLHF
jgi:opacity protein-like surface antigen